ncbi:MAG: UDP-N-acetylmuramoyl-L-alanyl-D-glutamate--2,6-diaminopimelate ligase [Phycisphaerae bacterium]|nr:UDP-N-acetylmuramoyl-L-alanyl-D-glutamate--2,6-diaminopimelate ligase [Phycisphaerae bacterium]
MLLPKLLEAAEIAPRMRRADAEVQAVVADSRRVGGGSCFVAVRGPDDDGHRYIAQAAAAGCSAVVCEDPAAVPKHLPCAVVDDTRQAVAALAQALRGWPARRLTVVGVTGTKGKSTVAHLVRAVLAGAGCPAGLLGTISYETGVRSAPAGNTTPGPIGLADMMAEMVQAGNTHLVMEVSSHALDQRRIAGLDFRVGVFTNFTGDHLDYHTTMEEYLRAKRLLFETLDLRATAVLNQDAATGRQLASSTRAKVSWYGLSAAADVYARIERIDAAGTRFALIAGLHQAPVATALIGRHNVYNCLAAAGVGMALGIDLPTIARALEGVAIVPGRLQRVPIAADYQVFVDYAHTDDALEKALGAIRPLASGRLILVFGCGGDRDRTKRPRMAAVAARLADRVVVTSDNPRSEDPQTIIDEILAGLDEAGWARTAVQVDRRAAIAQAIGEARAGDIVLIAGKGHETYQIIGDRRIHFDDAEAAAECMRQRPSTNSLRSEHSGSRTGRAKPVEGREGRA